MPRPSREVNQNVITLLADPAKGKDSGSSAQLSGVEVRILSSVSVANQCPLGARWRPATFDAVGRFRYYSSMAEQMAHISEQVVDLLRDYQQRHNVSVSEISRATDISRPMLSRVLAGKHHSDISAQTIDRILEYVGLEVGFFDAKKTRRPAGATGRKGSPGRTASDKRKGGKAGNSSGSASAAPAGVS